MTNISLANHLYFTIRLERIALQDKLFLSGQLYLLINDWEHEDIMRFGRRRISCLVAMLLVSGCASNHHHLSPGALETLLKQDFSGIPIGQLESRLGLEDVPRTEINTAPPNTRLYHFDGFFVHVFYDFSSRTVWTGPAGNDGPYLRRDGMTIVERQSKIHDEERKVSGAAARSGSQQSADGGTNTHLILPHGFRYVVPSEEQTKTLDAALGRMKLEKQAKSQTHNIDQAVVYLWQTINIAITSNPRVCTEYRDFFWFSGLDTAGNDQTFKSGFAVKKGTGEIYRWEDKNHNKASEAIGVETTPKLMFAELVAELESPDHEKREAACQGLVTLATGTPIPDAIPALEKLAESDAYRTSFISGKGGGIVYEYPIRKAAGNAIDEHKARSRFNDFLSQRTEPMPKRLVIALVNGQRIDLVAYDANTVGSDTVVKEAMVTKVSSPEVLCRLLSFLDRIGGNPLKYIDSYVLEWRDSDAMMLTAISGARQRMKKPEDAIPVLVDYSEKHLSGSKVGSDEWRVFCQYLVACKRTSIIPILIPSLSDKRIYVNNTAQLPPPPRRHYVIRTEVYNYLAELTGKPTVRGIEKTDKAVQVWIEWWEREGKEQYNQALHTDCNTRVGTKAASAETE